ncbi:MAG: flippase activity-associated protein Agl23 [Halobacteriales archaeon]
MSRSGRAGRVARSFRARLDGRDGALIALLGLTAASLLARLVLLGARVQHFDEGRVGWWVLHFMRTGQFEYRYIIHGPFIQHVNTWLFSVIGATDFSSRLVVAIVGGLLPLVALLFREHLRDAELVGVGAFLAFNPVLLYYSRFFRSTVLVAAFMTAAFGFLVRFADTRRPRYAHLAVAFTALGFTAKENAVVYLLCWLGAGALVVALSLYARPDGRTGAERVATALADLDIPDRRTLARAAGHVVLAVALFLVVIVFFYAPRGGPNGLYQALLDPARLPATLGSMVDSIEAGYRYWFGHSTDPGCHKDNLIAAYACFLGRSLEVLAGYAAPLLGLALVGALVEHFATKRPRWLVLVATYWGFVSVLGYPLGTDVFGAWIMVNALVPLAVPAGVGLALLYRWGVDAYRDDDRVSTGIVAVMLLLVVAQFAAVGLVSSYLEPTAPENGLVQYAQPEQAWRGTLADMDRLARTNDGTDVLVFGDHFVDGATNATRTPACVKWFNALPLPWYFEKTDVSVSCSTSTDELGSGGDRPPVVIARADDREVLADALGPGYEVRTHYLRTTGVETVVFVRG